MTDPKKPAPAAGMKTFKVGDAVKKPVERPRAGQKAAAPAGPGPSVGFPRIEALVEADQPDLAGFEARHQALAEMAKASKNQKEKLGAQRAAKAYEKARALLGQLFATKASLGQKDP